MRLPSSLITRGCLLFVALALFGCTPKDADPNAPVEAPGYYNGEMKGRSADGAK